MICSGSMPLRLGIATGAFQPYHHMGNFHESKVQQNPGDAGADRDELDALVGIDVRRIRVDDGDQQNALVQHPIVLSGDASGRAGFLRWLR